MMSRVVTMTANSLHQKLVPGRTRETPTESYSLLCCTSYRALDTYEAIYKNTSLQTKHKQSICHVSKTASGRREESLHYFFFTKQSVGSHQDFTSFIVYQFQDENHSWIS